MSWGLDQLTELQLQSPARMLPGREAWICMEYPARSAQRAPPPPNHGSPLTWGDGINPLDNEPAIADRSVSENADRPCRSQGLS
jgi:hypothetical protein